MEKGTFFFGRHVWPVCVGLTQLHGKWSESVYFQEIVCVQHAAVVLPPTLHTHTHTHAHAHAHARTHTFCGRRYTGTTLQMIPSSNPNQLCATHQNHVPFTGPFFLIAPLPYHNPDYIGFQENPSTLETLSPKL